MRIWIVTSALALAALCGAALVGERAARDGAPSVRVAAIQPEGMTDACVWSVETAAGRSAPCAEAAPPLVWPDDFIALTVSAATEAWQATVDFLGRAYTYAFDSDETPRKAGS